jgi:F-type H+-transporting ATPase subunit b
MSGRAYRQGTRGRRHEKTEAEKERDEFQHKNEEFDEQRAALLSKATDEAKSRKSAAPRGSAAGGRRLECQTRDALKREQQNLNDAISRRTQQEVFAIARKALTDLAGTKPGRTHGRGVHAPLARAER